MSFKIWLTDVASVALIVHSQGKSHMRVGHFRRISKAVNCQTPNWGQEDFDVSPGYKLSQ